MSMGGPLTGSTSCTIHLAGHYLIDGTSSSNHSTALERYRLCRAVLIRSKSGGRVEGKNFCKGGRT